jgi:predicted NBD/HSP70 family sugar kinase
MKELWMPSQAPSPNSNNLVLALDIGATNLRLALVDDVGVILDIKKVPTRKTMLLNYIKSEIKDFLGDRKIKGIGISVAGPVSNNSVTFTNLPGNTIRVSDFRDIHPTVFMLNDVVAALLADKGALAIENRVYITISSGINAGVVVDGNTILFEKCSDEAGHMRIESEFFFPCACGSTNCWEAYNSGPNIVRFYIAWAKANGIRVNTQVNEPEDIFNFSANDDGLKMFLIEGFGRVNNTAIEKIIEKYHPEKITFGGSVILNNKQIFLDTLSETVKHSAKIDFTEYGDDVSLTGIANYAFSQIL